MKDFWDKFQQLRILSRCCCTSNTVLQRVNVTTVVVTKLHCLPVGNDLTVTPEDGPKTCHHNFEPPHKG